MPEIDLSFIAIPSAQTGYRASRKAKREPTSLRARVEMLDISVEVPMLYIGKKTKANEEINAKGTQMEAGPVLGVNQSWDTGPWLPVPQVCRGVLVRGELGHILTSHAALLNLKPGKQPPAHLISPYRCSWNRRNLPSENDQRVGAEGGLAQLQCLQQRCSEAAGHGAGSVGHEQKESTAEGEPKVALQHLGWPQRPAAPGKEQLKAGRRQVRWGMEVVPALPPPEMWASEDDSQERLGKGYSLLCLGCWLMGDPGAVGKFFYRGLLRHY